MPEPERWQFHNPVRVHSGPSAIEALAPLVAEAGKGRSGRILVVLTPGGRRRGLLERLESVLPGETLEAIDDVATNPDLAALERQLARVEARSWRAMVAIGGGSVLDTAKVLSRAGAAQGSGWLRAHLLAGAAAPSGAGIPMIAVPTTAGTGSEVTPFATVWDATTRKKHSLAGPALFPYAALLDAKLTLELPPEATLSTGLDALAQGLESGWNRHANPVTLGFATRAVQMSLEALPVVLRSPHDLPARRRMLEASLLAGLAISGTRTALAHSMSYPITAHHGVPHGLACAFALPEILRFNASVDDGRLDALARAVGADGVDALVSMLERFLAALRVPEAIRGYCADPGTFAALAPEMFTPGRADNNLRDVDVAAVRGIVAAAARR